MFKRLFFSKMEHLLYSHYQFESARKWLKSNDFVRHSIKIARPMSPIIIAMTHFNWKLRYTHRNSSDQLSRSHITQYHCGYTARRSTIEGTMRYSDATGIEDCSSVRVPS